VLEDVREDVDRLGDVLVERLGIVDSLLARGVGVQVRAEVLDFELEAGLRARFGALESEMLDELARDQGAASRGQRWICDSFQPCPRPTHLEEMRCPARSRGVRPATSVDP
jgi:hypothetical protein